MGTALGAQNFNYGNPEKSKSLSLLVNTESLLDYIAWSSLRKVKGQSNHVHLSCKSPDVTSITSC